MVQHPSQITQDLFDELQKKNDKLLSKKGLPEFNRIVLENQTLMNMVIMSDHLRVEEMYPYFKQAEKESNRWEPRIWDIIKSIALLLVGVAIASLK